MRGCEMVFGSDADGLAPRGYGTDCADDADGLAPRGCGTDCADDADGLAPRGCVPSDLCYPRYAAHGARDSLHGFQFVDGLSPAYSDFHGSEAYSTAGI